MLRRHLSQAVALGTLAVLAIGCGKASGEEAAKLAADSARAAGASPAEIARRADRARAATVARAATPRSSTRTIASGTTLRLAGVTDITSQKNHAGDAYVARTLSASLASNGDTVIPVGAELIGSVTTLRSAPTPGGEGAMAIAFNTVRFNGQDYPIGVNVTSMATRSVARGVTIDDAAKVGVGAAAGAIAGRIIGHNRTGAAAGAVVGGAAGVVYANRTKDHDIVLSPGSALEVVLTAPFIRQVARN